MHNVKRSAIYSSLWSVFVFMGFSLVEFLLILKKTQGHFTYGLDDPYIHLALAKRIAQGHYGINMAEASAPSSSILWPIMLAAFTAAKWHDYLPLLLNVIFGCGAAAILGRIADEWPWPERDRFRALKEGILIVLLVLAANLVPLTFLGMEHVLQIFLALVCALGLIRAWNGSSIPAWCIAAAILAPSIRYECFTITVAVSLALYGQRRRLAAISAMLASCILPACFSLFLISQGLSPLPSSILSKGGFYDTRHAGLLYIIWGNLSTELTHKTYWPMLLLFLALAAVTLNVWKQPIRRWVSLGVTSAVLLQLLFDKFGTFDRYETYAKLFGLVLLLIFVASYRRIRWEFAAAAAILCAVPYIKLLPILPDGAANIYQQQAQMARFAHDYYRGNVAVNDLGEVSYKADANVYVLDLAGLASKDALQQRIKDAAWLDAITRKHKVGLVMIYPTWFSSIPADWKPVAALYLASPKTTTAYSRVIFYATPLADKPELEAELTSFSSTLPKGVKMVVDPSSVPNVRGKDYRWQQ